MAKLNIRPATVAALDHELLVDFQESQIPWLSTVGSGDQWGRQSVREANPNIAERTLGWVKNSETQREWGADWCRAWIAEANTEEASGSVPVAGLVLHAKSAAYVRSILPEQDHDDPFVYLTYLISNRNAGELRKGAGSALIAFAKEQVRNLGIHRLCLDCWRGNDRNLVRYYERQGFVPIADFTPTEKDWPGCVLEMRL